MNYNFLTGAFRKISKWASANSLWIFATEGGCCANELLETIGCRYDLERFGCKIETNPRRADLLVITTAITSKSLPSIKKIYDTMLEPKYVMVLGSCACSGGVFDYDKNYSVILDLSSEINVDVYVPGCPPRPEAIMNGLITLQEKIRGH